MKIAVCIKQVVTREWQLRVNDQKTWIRDQDASFELNEPDAYALEEALRLKEKHGGEVIVCSAGPVRAAQVIREALGGAIRDEQVDLVLTGLQSDDQGFGQVGVVLAETLGMPHATIIMEVHVDESSGQETGASGQGHGAPGHVRVKRELEGGWFQWVTLPLPALLTIQSGINQLRYATLKGIMAAKKKEIKKVVPAAAPQPAQRIASLYFPEKGKKTQMIAGGPAEAAKELVKRLKEDARVL